MKQNMRRLWLMVCLVFSLLALSACTAAEPAPLEGELANEILMLTAGALESINAVPEDSVEAEEAEAIKEKNTAIADGLSSWKSVMHDTGKVQNVISGVVTESEDGGYECVLTVEFASRKGEFKGFFAEDYDSPLGVSPTTFSFTPEYTTGEKLAKAGMNTLMGMGIVFLVLIFISILISCFKYINAFENKNKVAAPAPAAPAPAPVPVAEEENLAEDLELAAVITAAIAAFDNTSADGLVVRSIKRAPGAKWKRA